MQSIKMVMRSFNGLSYLEVVREEIKDSVTESVGAVHHCYVTALGVKIRFYQESNFLHKKAFLRFTR